MAAIVAPVALPDEAQLRQANLVTLIVVIVVCAVLLAAVISVLGCLFFCFRKKRCVLRMHCPPLLLTSTLFSYLISREKKNMRNEVKESVRHTSREVASVQKYLRDTSHISQPPVSLAVISSSTPPAVRRLVAETTASEPRVSSEQDGEEEIVVDEDRCSTIIDNCLLLNVMWLN